MINTKRISNGFPREIDSDQLDDVIGGNDTANAVAYFVGHMIGEAAQIVKDFGSTVAGLAKK
jgi:hypothetical protein